MATAELTDRQKEIRKLLDEGKTPPEIATKLKISDNAVYQQLRRMRQRNGGSATPARPARRRSTGSRSTRPRPSAASRRGEVPTMTPLQAIRGRRDVIGHELRVAEQELQRAQGAAKRASDAYDKLKARHGDELKQLNAAERALGHSKPAPRKRAPRKRTAKAKAPAPTTGS